MVSSCSHVTSSTTWCCHNTFISFTVLPRKTCSRLSMIRTGPSSKVSSASTISSPQSTTSRIWGVLLEYGIPCAHSTNSVVAPTDMQPCPPCDTNYHTPTFSAQHVRRLTRARPAFSRSILSHGIVLEFLIVAPSHVERLDLARHRPT